MKEFHSITTVVVGNGGQLEKKAKENEVYAYLGWSHKHENGKKLICNSSVYAS